MQDQFTAEGRFETPNASRYLQQLCKHFGHKIEVSFDERQGKIDFAFGPADLSADGETLMVKITTGNEEDLSRGRNVIDKHLERFAFREGFKEMDWTPPGA